jgi:membrane protease YdiL (CAAX protease family)
MIFLDLYTIPNGTTGIDTIVSETMTAVPSFVPLLLVFTFFVTFLGGISRQKARTGTSDYAMWSVIASLSTFMLALLMTLGVGLINLSYLVYTLVIAIICSVWLFFDRKPSEV